MHFPLADSLDDLVDGPLRIGQEVGLEPGHLIERICTVASS
jgi:hypothetical protein